MTVLLIAVIVFGPAVEMAEAGELWRVDGMCVGRANSATALRAAWRAANRDCGPFVEQAIAIDGLLYAVAEEVIAEPAPAVELGGLGEEVVLL